MVRQAEVNEPWQCADVDALLEAGSEFSLEQAMELYMHLHFCHGACAEHVMEKMETGEMSKLFGVEVTQAKTENQDVG